jgi:hypothetical protein
MPKKFGNIEVIVASGKEAKAKKIKLNKKRTKMGSIVFFIVSPFFDH